jgi:hypothetical protein
MRPDFSLNMDEEDRHELWILCRASVDENLVQIHNQALDHGRIFRK